MLTRLRWQAGTGPDGKYIRFFRARAYVCEQCAEKLLDESRIGRDRLHSAGTPDAQGYMAGTRVYFKGYEPVTAGLSCIRCRRMLNGNGWEFVFAVNMDPSNPL